MMPATMRAALCGVLLMTIALSPAFAGENRSDDDRRWGDLTREDIHELIDAYRFKRLSKALALDEEQTIEIMQEHEALHREIKTLRRGRHEIREELKEHIQAEASDDLIEGTLGKLIEIDHKVIAIRQEAYERISEDFSPAQRAKFYLFMHEFDRDIRRMIMRARQAKEENAEPKEHRGDEEKSEPRKEGNGDPEDHACLSHSGPNHYECAPCATGDKPGQFVGGRLR